MASDFAVALPTFTIGILSRASSFPARRPSCAARTSTRGVVLCVVMMSVSTLFYIIGETEVLLRKTPAAFRCPADAKHTTRLSLDSPSHDRRRKLHRRRNKVLQDRLSPKELGKDYVKTARAKGLSEAQVLFKRVMKNAMIPILTNVVVSIPFLFTARSSWKVSSPYRTRKTTINAINAGLIYRSMVYLRSILFIIRLVMTDISCSIRDPRIRFE